LKNFEPMHEPTEAYTVGSGDPTDTHIRAQKEINSQSLKFLLSFNFTKSVKQTSLSVILLTF